MREMGMLTGCVTGLVTPVGNCLILLETCEVSCGTCSELSHQEIGEWEHLSTGSFPPWLKVALGVADQSVARAHPEAAEKTLRKRDGELQVE